jgi:6-hydroxytryprostatin B O-methyltransferase
MGDIEIPTSALEELSIRLHANAKQLSYSLQSKGGIQSSLEIDAPGEAQGSSVGNIVPDLRNKVKQDALKLFRLASEPKDYVAHIALNVRIILKLQT